MGNFYIIGTPIGNLEDITHRSLRVLAELELLICEDTRVTRRIYSHYHIPFPSRVCACFESREPKIIPFVLEELKKGTKVGLCSDSGMPCISDPGYKLVQAVLDAGHQIDVIPGVTAVETALVLSGLPTSSYTFKGFPPRKEGPTHHFLEMDKELPHTLIFYESPYRVLKFLEQAYRVLGDRCCAVCFEMTKKFERVFRGYISDVIEALKTETIKGEVTIVIAGNHPKFIRENFSKKVEN
ncbi:MAG TPA: 16S rRNA (cytidine(1402)-2'-O)-methyltransferase [Candidatus Hydrogenedens sp.]|nr:16S rRNA (cytidine(1402)-2'-O)-methyltransferase [Candidatus Hydrogenedens sp.]